MTTLNIQLTDAQQSFVDQQAISRGFGSAAEYLQHLVELQINKESLRALLRKGMDSPVVGEFDSLWFDELRGKYAR